MTTDRQANTSLYIEPDLKLEAQKKALDEGKKLTTLINELLTQYLKS